MPELRELRREFVGVGTSWFGVLKFLVICRNDGVEMSQVKWGTVTLWAAVGRLSDAIFVYLLVWFIGMNKLLESLRERSGSLNSGGYISERWSVDSKSF